MPRTWTDALLLPAERKTGLEPATLFRISMSVDAEFVEVLRAA